MEDNSNIKTRTDFSTTYTDVNIGTMYKAQENNTDVYYFAGDARNNWVKFGGFYWRIIRTNSDGSVRLLYAGTSPDTTEAYIGKSAFNETYEDPMYAGYMYGTSGSLDLNRTNENNSTIKTYIDNWYNNNLSSYTKYLSTEAVYCNDREVKKGNYSLSGPMFEFGSSVRIDTNNQPTYDCANKKDAFSGSNTEAKLLYPIALMTADEVTYAGGRHIGCIDGGVEGLLTTWYSLNSKKEGATDTTWWFLLSPAVADSSAYNFHMYHEGCLGVYSSVGNIWGVRPVISLKSDVLYKLGDGSASNPYEVNAEPVNMYTVSLTVNNGSGTSTVLVEEGKGATFTVTPNSGYKAELETNTCGGTLSGSTYTISNITSAKTCSITFKKNLPTLSSLIQANAVNENGYRYEGTNPNNYIYMVKNNSRELWRIIGLFPDGTSGENVIRVRKVGYEEAAYDTSAVNHWPKATLYKTLSSTYNLANYKNTVNYKMYLGGADDESLSIYTLKDLYDMERMLNSKGTAGGMSSGATTFTGSVGLMYPSDYGYGVLASDCARTIKPYNYYVTAACYTNNWLYQGDSTIQWLISPNSSDINTAFRVATPGYLCNDRDSFISDRGSFSPVMALKSDVTVSGSGTQSDPYVMTN